MTLSDEISTIDRLRAVHNSLGAVIEAASRDGLTGERIAKIDKYTAMIEAIINVEEMCN